MRQWYGLVFVLSMLFLDFTSSSSRAADVLEPPRAAQRPNVTHIFGDVLVDNYYWMRNRSDPDLLKYIASENSYADASLIRLKRFAHVLSSELKSRIPRGEAEEIYVIGSYIYFYEYEGDLPYPIWYRKPDNPNSSMFQFDNNHQNISSAQLVLNMNVFVSTGASHLELSLLAPSPDERLVAFSVDFAGNERLTLYVREIQTQRTLIEIANVSYSLAWSADSSTFFYTRSGMNLTQPLLVFRHQLGGGDGLSDLCVFNETDATYELFLSTTNDGEYITINANGLESTEVRYVRAASAHSDSFQVFWEREATVRYFLEHNNGAFYVFTNINSALNYKIVRVRADDIHKNHSVMTNDDVIVPHSPTRLLIQMEMHREHLVVFARENNEPQVLVVNLRTNTELAVVPLPPYLTDFSVQPSHDSMNIYELVKFQNLNSSRVQFSVTSHLVPLETFEYDLYTRRLHLLSRLIYSHYIPSKYTIRKVFVPARDGASIAVSLAYHRDAVDFRSGTNALLLSAYGAYGDTQGPYFDAEILSALDRGVVFARAHIRGSAMNGTAWYIAGKALSKRNSCTDVIDVVQWLVAESIASRDRVALVGRSAGGLLMAGVLTMRPDLAAVVMMHVPFVDVLNTMLDPSISYTVWEYSEWGNPTIESHFEYMKTYDPYQNIRATKYPSVYITTGWNDVLVNYWEPVKFTAHMRDTVVGGEILLRVTDSGHTGSTGEQYFDDAGMQFAYLLEAVGSADLATHHFIIVAGAVWVVSIFGVVLDIWRASRL